VSYNATAPGDDGVLLFNDGGDVILNGDGKVRLSINLNYRIVQNRAADAHGKVWKVSATGWIYHVADSDCDVIADFHWHPRATPDVLIPHLHTPEKSPRRHFPTGRVLIEDVLHFCVECGASPYDADMWQQIHDRNIENFKLGATWGSSFPRRPATTQERATAAAGRAKRALTGAGRRGRTSKPS
jgi:hypothetical protein